MSSRTASFLSKNLRRHAASSGWPTHVAASLSVQHKGGQYTTTYPEHLSEEVLDLEYGTPSTTPSPAIRQFHNRAEQMAGGLHTQEALQYLDDMGVL